MANTDIESWEIIERSAKNLRFNILRNAYYHDDRCQYLTTLDRFSKALSVLFGTAIAAKFLADIPEGTLFIAIVITLLQIIGIVFNVSPRAVYHGERKMKYYSMLSEIEEGDLSLETIRKFNAKLTREHEKEPSIFWCVDALAWNNAYCSMILDIDFKKLIPIKASEKLLRHVIRFSPQNFREREIRERGNRE